MRREAYLKMAELFLLKKLTIHLHIPSKYTLVHKFVCLFLLSLKFEIEGVGYF